jgi:hypothetical protein
MSIGYPIEEQAESHSFIFQMRKIMTDEMSGAYEMNRLLSGFDRCKASALPFLARHSLEAIAERGRYMQRLYHRQVMSMVEVLYATPYCPDCFATSNSQ